MGIFATVIKKAMDEKNIKQADFRKLSGGRITQSGIGAVMRGVVPRALGAITQIAKVIGEKEENLRIYAVLDIIERETKRYRVKWGDVCKEVAKMYMGTHSLPVYDLDRLKECLSDKGYPAKESESYVEVATDYGPYAYAVKVDSDILAPRVMQGEIAIVSIKDKGKGITEEYGIVADKKKRLHVGRIIEHPHYVILETMRPYGISHMERKDIVFLHRVVAIQRKL